MRNRSIALIFGALLATTSLAPPAAAQIAPPGPVRDAIDANGVDLFSGRMMLRAPGLRIGGTDQGMSYARVFRQTTWTDDLIATLDWEGSVLIVSQGLRADGFTYSGGVYTSTEGNGATLTLSGNIHTYTAADGTVIHFGNGPPVNLGVQGQVTDITRPDGTKFTFTYATGHYCSGTFSPSGCNVPETYIHRLMSVQSSFGYKVAFTHASIIPGLRGQYLSEWFQVVGANVTNLAGATGAAVASNSYSVTATTRTITDAMSRATQYTMSGSDLTGIRMPGSASDDVTIGYISGRVTSVATAAGTTSYASSDAAGIRTVTVTDPLSHATTYKFDIASKRMTERTDANGHTTTMQYDSSGRLTRTTAPEGNYVQLTYDGRGNVTETRAVAKAGSGLADIVTTASFPASCANPKTCNQPTTTTDARGNVTDYTYDSGHGGVLTVTAPAPTVGAVRPQTRYSYTSLQAYYRNASGSIVASGIPVLRLTGVSACQTLTSCTGAADEVKSTVSYGPQVTGTGNNLLPVSTSSGAGNGSLTATTAFTYNEIGNLTYVDGPLAGTDDTTRTLYNAARECTVADLKSARAQPGRWRSTDPEVEHL
jgi:YD repeat-containing protein